jgi:hypothetical protein
VWLKITYGVPASHLQWLTPVPATSYDIVRGNLATLRASGGDFTASTEACLVNDTTSMSFDDPAPGAGWWYLVRGRNGAVVGSWSDGSASQVGSRDAEIAASGNACP